VESGNMPEQADSRASRILVRKYRRADRQTVLDITEDSFGGYCLEANMEKHFGSIAGTTWSERKLEGIDYDLRRHPNDTFVAEVDGEVAGYVATRIYSNVLTGHVANMAVLRRFQGIGVGKALMEAALNHFRREGMQYARVETLEQNFKGQRFYPAYGFKEIGRQIFYFREL
jgi:ribosomal protein S18 acetylase RimI-like enzyme